MRTLNLRIDGMTCGSCERILHNTSRKIQGVHSAQFYHTKGIGSVTFDPAKTDDNEIISALEKEGYTITRAGHAAESDLLWGALALAGIALIILLATRIELPMPDITGNASLALIFLTGLITGFHCIAMCGGFVVAYSTKATEKGDNPHQSHIFYGIGKTISYTFFGAVFGLIGGAIAITPKMRGTFGILAGAFLVLYGISMFLPLLRWIRFREPAFVARFVARNKAHQSPFVIGLLNGLMIACGPLQAMYLMAAASASALQGAIIMFFFGLGTLPVMIGFGYFATWAGKSFSKSILKVSGILVIILGAIMIGRGMALAGYNGFSGLNSITGYVPPIGATSAQEDGPAEYQIVRMDVTRFGFEPNKLTIKKGVPVKWIVNGKQLNGCNNEIIVPSKDIDFKVQPGEQTIEFTPTETGTIPFSCWMGMIRGSFTVVENDASVAPATTSATAPAVTGAAVATNNAPSNSPTCGMASGGSCGGAGCGCGCGAAR